MENKMNNTTFPIKNDNELTVNDLIVRLSKQLEHDKQMLNDYRSTVTDLEQYIAQEEMELNDIMWANTVLPHSEDDGEGIVDGEPLQG